MTTYRRTKMDWTWRDPRGISHLTDQVSWQPGHLMRRTYETWCGFHLSVDDINQRTTVRGIPTCLRCVVASEPPREETR